MSLEQGVKTVAVARRALTAQRLGYTAGGLLVVSATLQAVAAAERWIFAGADVTGPDRTVEDHLFDYTIPLDPWVSVGNAATLFGVAYLLIAASIVCIGLAARALGSRGGILPAAIVAAAPFAYFAVHALVSGLLGTPSPLAGAFAATGAVAFGVVQVVALVILAAIIVRRAALWAAALIVLTGTSIIGYLVSTFSVAPLLVGYQSYDTTPWTEGVLAAVTAVAATIIVVGAVRTTRTA